MRTVPDLPEIRAGDDLGVILADAISRAGMSLQDGDIIVLAHKIVSKAEGRVIKLDDVVPSEKALQLAPEVRKDPAKVELILRESRAILRIKAPTAERESVIICQHRSGLIMANAGIDESNVPDNRSVVLLPEDPDASAHSIRSALLGRFGAAPGVIMTDSFGRPWRMGLVNVAIGLAGVPGLVNLCEQGDAYGRPLRATIPAFADEVSAAAGLLMHKSANAPAVLVRGLKWQTSDVQAASMLRPETDDLFR